MNTVKIAALVGGFALAVAGCTSTVEEAPPSPPEPAVTEAPAPPPPPAPEPVSPVEQEPTDNCGLDPADMDQKTKVQCGLVEETEVTESDPNHCDDPSYWNSQQSGDPSAYVEACGEWPSWVPGSEPTELTDEGSSTSEYEQYQQDTGYPYSEEEYDSLYGYQKCGTACGKEPTSGEIQHQYGCEQGYITEGC